MRGLVIREPWISKILAGGKTWEMRSTTTTIRGEIALIRQRSGLVVGTAELVDSLPALTPSNYMNFCDRHAVPSAMLDEVIKNRWVHPWVLADVRALTTPVPYKHNYGAVTFVTLDASVSDAVRSQAGLSKTGVAIETRAATPPVAAAPARPASDRTPDHLKNLSHMPLHDDKPARRDDGAPVFVFRPEVAQAHGVPLPDGRFVVLKGSTAMREGSPLKKRDRQLRDELVRSNVLTPDNDKRLYRFSVDHEFASASSAAGIIKDGNASGPSLWKDENSGLSLKDFLIKHPSDN